jgi:hypothetical protein
LEVSSFAINLPSASRRYNHEHPARKVYAALMVVAGAAARASGRGSTLPARSSENQKK